MTEKNTNDNDRALELLKSVFNLWTTLGTNNEGIETRSPGSEEELVESRKIFNEISALEITDKDVLEFYNELMEVLDDYSSASGGPAGNEQGKYDQAWEKLGEIFNLWSNVSIEDGNELRSPANKKEIKESRALMREVLSLKVSEQDVLQRIKELEGVIDSNYAAFPKYTARIIRAIIFSLVFMVGIYFYLTQNTYKTPEINYEKEWFVTKKGGYLLWDAFISDKDLPEVKQKIYLKKGTQLTPIAQIGNWVQAETENGQRGLLDPLILNGSKYVVAKSGAKVFMKMGSDKADTIPEGTAGIIIDRHTNKDHVIWTRYLKIKFDDGKIRWAYDHNFKQLMMESLPEIEQLYYHTTNASMFQKLTIGKQLHEFEKHYGPATSVLKINGKRQAFFRHIYVMDEGRLYKGVLVNLDDDNVALDIEYITKGWKRTYEIFPLVTTMRDAEIQKGGRETLYRQPTYKLQWWEDFKDMNWFTVIIGWIVWFILIVTAVFLYFSIPRIIISPIMQIFTYNKVFANGMVILINAIVLLIIYYVFFVFSILMMDQWLIPAVGSVVLYFFWLFRLSKNISYNRCPMCNVMYSALNKGSTHTGTKTNVSWGTYDVYSHTSESSTTITKHYDRRSKKTTETIDSYLDHRMCALCGYNWDVDRDETEENTKRY